MALPSNFWEEFDKRLSAKFDAEFEKRLQPINDSLKQLLNWTKRQDKMIELELNSALRAHLEEQFKGYYTVFPTAFPKEILDTLGNRVTDFDGAYVITNSTNVINLVSPPRHSPDRLLPETVFQPGVIAYIVIVEAKQNLTVSKLKDKMKQVERIQSIVKECNADPDKEPREFRHIGLRYFNPSVGLYIGGQDISPTVKEAMKEAIEKRRANALRPIMMGWLELNGTRFSVLDEENDFGASLARGGAGRRPRVSKK